MMNRAMPRTLSAILCADWGKEFKKRAVYVADVSGRVVQRIPGDDWSVARVLEEAERRASSGSALATFDAPLGVPESYLAAIRRLSKDPIPTFLDLLPHTRTMARFFDATSVARDWSVERPFVSVPAGRGGLASYVDAARRQGVETLRQVDKATGAKPPRMPDSLHVWTTCPQPALDCPDAG